ncbi:DinB family protein [Parapedobacter lycopersici]|uniref:DinB family protein n=1 Tax=Parapedobacter lycopersici TaxID=1864939 RepID=UPI0033427BBD
MDTSRSAQLNMIIPAYRMHTQIFMNALDGISEEDALKRIEGRTNHVAWMAGNFVNTRYGLAGVLGINEKDPFDDLFFQGKALDTQVTYPTLSELKANFHKISPVVYDALLKITDTRLKEEVPLHMNISFFPETLLNFIGMCIGREDYLCGQIGLMRRILDYPGMKYDVDEQLKY